MFLQPGLVGRCMSLQRSWCHSFGSNLPLSGMGMDQEWCRLELSTKIKLSSIDVFHLSFFRLLKRQFKREQRVHCCNHLQPSHMRVRGTWVWIVFLHERNVKSRLHWYGSLELVNVTCIGSLQVISVAWRHPESWVDVKLGRPGVQGAWRSLWLPTMRSQTSLPWRLHRADRQPTTIFQLGLQWQSRASRPTFAEAIQLSPHICMACVKRNNIQ